MTPHEHYKQAEKLLNQAETDVHLSWEMEASLLRRAQVHATLAGVVSWPTEER